MLIRARNGQIVIEFSQLAVQLTCERQADGRQLAAWLNTRTGRLIELVAVGQA